MAELTEPLEFPGLEPITVPVTIGKKKYSLREASEEAVIAYKDAITSATQIDGQGKPQRITGISGSESILVSKCLFELYEVGGEVKERPVLLSTVRSWPSRVVRPLFDRIQAISEIWRTEKDEKKDDSQNGTPVAEEPAKNEPSATAGTSA